MAGRPKRRAQLQAIQTPPGEDIPEALPGATRAHDARERAAPRAVSGTAGTFTRQVADQAAGGELAELARLLRPGTTVRLERLRPSWCAGWLEDIELDAGGMRDLYDHVRNEWGGQRYRMQVLLPSGQVAFTSALNISGPPLHEGRRIDRDEWEGYGSSSRRTNTQQAQQQRAPAKDDLTGILGVFKLIMDTQSESSKAQLESVRELVRTSAAQNQDLIEALASRDGERAGRASLREQLGEIVEATQAIEGVRKVLGGRQSNSRDAAKDDPMQEALREATKHFIGGAMGSIFTRKQGGSVQRPPQVNRRAPPQSPPRSGVRQSGIPDAVTGQAAARHRN